MVIVTGDITGAWAQGNRANNEFLIVEFERPVYPEQIDIYETYNPGAVVRVAVRNSRTARTVFNYETLTTENDNNVGWETVWQTATPHVEGRCKSKSCQRKNFLRSLLKFRFSSNLFDSMSKSDGT